MLYTAGSSTIPGSDSRRYSLQMPLIRSPGRPAGGWKATLPIKGQTVEVTGRTGQEVYNAARMLLNRNGEAVSSLDLWANLNVQWLSRTPDRYHLVRMSTLMASVKAKASENGDQDKRRRNYKPSDWGYLAWGWLNLFLAKEDYNYREFLMQLKYVLDILNPDRNPEIGCAECYRDFGIAVSGFEKMPNASLDTARKWLVDVHNAVNKKLSKPVLSYAQAAKAAFWI